VVDETINHFKESVFGLMDAYYKDIQNSQEKQGAKITV